MGWNIHISVMYQAMHLVDMLCAVAALKGMDHENET